MSADEILADWSGGGLSPGEAAVIIAALDSLHAELEKVLDLNSCHCINIRELTDERDSARALLRDCAESLEKFGPPTLAVLRARIAKELGQ
jgi:hypothetical protein